MKYRGGYSIKDLRKDLDGGLGWAHSTESVAQYLETVIPSVREAKIKGCFRHTSSQDKTDPKKVVTTSFYKSRGGKLATCHAHGDGTWCVFFTRLGEEELQKQAVDISNNGQLDVYVRAEVKDDGLCHHGEMKNKPLACRGHISLNNDEVHRAYHPNGHSQGDVKSSSMTIGTAEPKQDDPISDMSIASFVGANESSNKVANAKSRIYYQGFRNQLEPEHVQLALSLARDDLTKKEERALLQKLKAIPWELQEQILKQSKTTRSEVKG